MRLIASNILLPFGCVIPFGCVRMANVTFNTPKVQEELTIKSGGSGFGQTNVAAKPAQSPFFADTSTTPFRASGFESLAVAPQADKNKSRGNHHNHRKQKNKPKEKDQAVPSDFVNLINADKVKVGADTQAIFTKTPTTAHKRSRSQHSDSDGSDSDSDSGSGGDNSDSDASSSSGSDSDATPSTQQKEATTPPSQSLLFDKAKVLARLARRQRLNPNSVIEFNHNMSLDELMTIDVKAGYESQADMSIQLMKRAIMFVVGMTEKASSLYPAMGMNLKGWGEHVFLTMQQYDETLFDIYDLYSSAFQMNPIIRLSMALTTSAWMYSASKTMMEEVGTVHNTTIDQLQEAIKKAKEAQAQQQTPAPGPAQPTTKKQTTQINVAAMKPPSSSSQQTIDPAAIMHMLSDPAPSSSNVRKVDVSARKK